jgi:glucose-1-phosphate thymidylyltransferase
MKVVIPVAGIGSKLRPHTHTQPKALVPVAGKPILSHLVDQLMLQGADEFVFIIGYLGDKIEDYINQKYPKLKASFVVQEPRLGTGHAVYMAKDKIDSGEEVLIVLGDTIVDFDLQELRKKNHSVLGIKKVDDPRSFGVAELDEQGNIIRVVEKPAIPKSNHALVGIYLIRESGLLFDSLEAVNRKRKSNAEEFSLTDGIQKMIEEHKVQFNTFQAGNWFDCGSKESLLETNATLLKRLNTESKKYNFPNTIIIHPVVIGANCKISGSILGPNVSIGENTVIQSSIIADSIIGTYSNLTTAVLSHSIIGSDTSLKGLSQSLNIGDSTEIDFT